jgi:hypothetical protein
MDDCDDDVVSDSDFDSSAAATGSRLLAAVTAAAAPKRVDWSLRTPADAWFTTACGRTVDEAWAHHWQSRARADGGGTRRRDVDAVTLTALLDCPDGARCRLANECRRRHSEGEREYFRRQFAPPSWSAAAAVLLLHGDTRTWTPPGVLVRRSSSKQR